jgi:hypothetical protein
MSRARLYFDEYFISGRPKEFYQNEKFNGFFAQVCNACGIVSLEKSKGPYIFLCELCRFKFRNTGQVNELGNEAEE